ncbi:glycosyltransferase [Krasilnikoviella flava]|uniref:Dolichol-phosphate mannosyltransferase n=1 Tax=Krasilnikoviella flava TaxID=526729 RepID=A0A1T5IEJ1_9MICO|nr:glycosyltransferase [Krasilnikoviella flava]SKC37616.1 dolichol-phosphate mannosyltransferase [Krasilnikoviella flava]
MTVDVTVVVPTYNEGPNVAELVRRLAAALGPDGGGQVVPGGVEVLFVDDSRDDTPAVIEQVAARSALPVRMIHREVPDGGLSGAVVAGLRAATGERVVVMDGDLQHPPEMVPVLLATARETGADVVVASRYTGRGDAGGLDGRYRRWVSKASGLLARSMFPVKLRDVSDPMTGFFVVRRAAVDLAALRPRGFKILLEILARQRLVVVEEPFVFGERFAGRSKATVANGLRYVQQLTLLRFGRLSPFALIGALGAVLNLAILAGLQALGVHYLPAVVWANVVTIVINFLLQERFVFADLREGAHGFWGRFVRSFAFNGTEAAVRTLLLWWIVERAVPHPELVQAVLILVAFVVRFVFQAQVVYRPRGTSRARGRTGDRPGEHAQP